MCGLKVVVCGLKVLVYVVLRYYCVRPLGTSVGGLEPGRP